MSENCRGDLAENAHGSLPFLSCGWRLQLPGDGSMNMWCRAGKGPLRACICCASLACLACVRHSAEDDRTGIVALESCLLPAHNCSHHGTVGPLPRYRRTQGSVYHA